MFDTTAEVLTGLMTAYPHYETEVEESMRHEGFVRSL